MFTWKNEYSVGNQEVDAQHQRLFDIGNKVYEITSLNDETDRYDEIIQVLYELKEYTEYHFEYEEKLMEACNFESIDEHKIIHAFFIKKVDKILQGDIDVNQSQAILNIMNFIADWIVSHILNEDFKYIESIKNLD